MTTGILSDDPHNVSQCALPPAGLCAHRGAMVTHPENTIPAFKKAIQCGAHMIEFDVQRTRDHALVIMHDPTVDRTTNGHGPVAEHSLAHIRSLDAGAWKSPDFVGTKVPTLEEVLDLMPDNIWLNIHLKGQGDLGEQVTEILVQKKRLHQAFLACDAQTAHYARTVTPDILICNMERQGNSWAYVQETLRLGTKFIQLYGDIIPAYGDYVQALHQAGVKINYFGTDNPEKLRTLFSLGIDFPLVNNVYEAMSVAQGLGMPRVSPVWRGSHNE